MRSTRTSLYVHGAPGISKSAVARQVADELGIAFVDLRLSQMAPEDVRGVPMLGEVHGVKGVLWHPPLVFPRDLDYENTEWIDGRKTIRFFNPVGNNGVHYCTAPLISAVSEQEPWVTAEIVDQKADRFTITLRDSDNNPTKGAVTWSVSGRAKGILGLEEFNSASPAVTAACYQLVHDHRLGDYIVPDGFMLVAMGNRDGDNGVTYKLRKPVANRFVHIEMIVNFDDWLAWAVSHDIDPDVIGYLARWPSKLLDFDPNSPKHAFASPRTWEMVSKIVQQPDPDPDVVRALVCGAIGDPIGNEFLLHRQFMADMPDVRSIFNGSTTTFRPDKAHATQIAHSTAVQMLHLLKEQNDLIRLSYPDRDKDAKSPERKQWYLYANRAIGFMLDHFAPEVTVAAVKMALTTHGLNFSSVHMPRYREFSTANKEFFF